MNTSGLLQKLLLFGFLLCLLYSMTYEAAKVWICGVTICLEGVHFCHPKTKMCSKCADFSQMCFTEHHQPNCTTWCQDDLSKKIEQDLRDQPCGPVMEITNGHHNGTTDINGTFARGDVLYFICNKGHFSYGPSKITCSDFGQWSSIPPTCEGVSDNIYRTLFHAICPTLFVLVIAAIVLIIYMRIINQRLRKRIGKTEEESLLYHDEPEMELEDKREPVLPLYGTDTCPDTTREKRLSSQTDDSGHSARESENTRAKQNAVTVNNNITIINKTGDEKKDEKQPSKPKETTFAIQETEPDSDITKLKTIEPVDLREEEQFLDNIHPQEDDIGEKGLSPDLPFFAQALERQLSEHQKELEGGAEKIALCDMVIDQQDFGQ